MGHLASGRPARAFAGLILVAAVFSAMPGAGDDPVAWGYDLAHSLMSPYCPGRTLSQCPSPQAAELRQWIIFQAAAGASREEVEAQLLERFGPEILQVPKAEGWGASAYVIPIVAFAVGAVFVLVLLRRLVRPASTPPAVAATVVGTPADGELERLVDEELQQG